MSSGERRKETSFEDSGIDALYDEAEYWKVNLGESRVHARRIPGRFRALKWGVASLYLLFFLAPYLRWEGRQAILFDIPARKYHLFGLTIWPQDIWMLSIVLLAFFLALYAMTALAGRVFCGYICWQTVWVDVYTWVEEKIEGPPAARRALDAAPWSGDKLAKRGIKQAIFLFLSALTGVTFTSYFIEVGELWSHYVAFDGPVYIWTVPLIFTVGSYLGVAVMREQVCFWLCPYARIQGVMTDSETLMPTYDFRRGEKRERMRKGAAPAEGAGDCVDCGLCVAVCPTGVDIRNGQQEGCVTCGLCIDACDTVMAKVDRPAGLVRYMSLDELRGGVRRPWYRRARVVAYVFFLLSIVAVVGYGVTHLAPLKLAVIHERQPLFVRLSDGAIQNRYTVKIINRTGDPMTADLAISGVEGGLLNGKETIRLTLPAGKVTPLNLFVKAPPASVGDGNIPLVFTLTAVGDETVRKTYESAFMGPGAPQ
jgi:cytochrome c oxidase accessory protein FixG